MCGLQWGSVGSNVLSAPGADAAARTVPLFLAIGRLVPVKGFDTLLKAWEQIPAQLQIVGDGPEQASLEAMVVLCIPIREGQLPGFQERYPGLNPRCGLRHHLFTARGVFLCFAEAMLIGTPVLSTDVPIANEVLDAQYLCPTNSPEALAALIWRHLPEWPGVCGIKILVCSLLRVGKKPFGLSDDGRQHSQSL